MTKFLAVMALGLATTCALGAGLAACGSNGGNGTGGDDGGSDATAADTGNGDGTTGVDGHIPSDGSLGDNSSGDGSGSSSGGDGGSGFGDGGLFNGDGGCFKLASACKANGDCCTGDCSNGVCSVPQCTSDGLACTSSAQCCGGNCVNNVCAPLNPTCGTLGNACGGTQPACCSNYCVAGHCQQPSFCSQVGDSCSTGTDCCSGICTKTGTQGLGVCGSPPGGGANCGMTDGMLCAGSTPDGGIVVVDGGLPACGGGCCSRSCAPWGPTGVLVCQPASGCHLVGDLCHNDSECCGSAAFPAADGGAQSQGGYATCSATDGGVGVCQNPTGCKPNGAVCRLATNSCNSSCDCCSGNCHADTCNQDNLGIPRCTGPQCVNSGGACSSSADCCNGNPCVPNPVDAGPPFTCYPYQCVQACGTCSNNADCCPGTNCVNGTCDPCGSGNPPGDGGSGGPTDGSTGLPDGSGLPPDGGAPPPPDGGCASYGQLCSTSADCCNGIPCTNGRCEFPLQ
jgi:hypothetical protein